MLKYAYELGIRQAWAEYEKLAGKIPDVGKALRGAWKSIYEPAAKGVEKSEKLLAPKMKKKFLSKPTGAYAHDAEKQLLHRSN